MKITPKNIFFIRVYFSRPSILKDKLGSIELYGWLIEIQKHYFVIFVKILRTSFLIKINKKLPGLTLISALPY